MEELRHPSDNLYFTGGSQMASIVASCCVGPEFESDYRWKLSSTCWPRRLFWDYVQPYTMIMRINKTLELISPMTDDIFWVTHKVLKVGPGEWIQGTFESEVIWIDKDRSTQGRDGNDLYSEIRCNGIETRWNSVTQLHRDWGAN